jgi:hypothetical protein
MKKIMLTESDIGLLIGAIEVLRQINSSRKTLPLGISDEIYNKETVLRENIMTKFEEKKISNEFTFNEDEINQLSFTYLFLDEENEELLKKLQ